MDQELQYKSGPSFMLKVEDSDSEITGIFAVHGNVDDGGDRTYPGLFGDFKVDGRDRCSYLWSHDSNQPAIAKIMNVYEIGRADLPPAVMQYAPNCTGGVAVTRRYLADDFARRVYGAVKAEAQREMSYAYWPKDWKNVTEGDRYIRDLFKADLYDISDVIWGMNPATTAAGQKGQPLVIQAKAARATVASLTERYESLSALRAKEGRRFSSATLEEIQETIGQLKTSAARLEKLITSDDGKGRPSLADIQRERQVSADLVRRITQLGA